MADEDRYVREKMTKNAPFLADFGEFNSSFLELSIQDLLEMQKN